MSSVIGSLMASGCGWLLGTSDYANYDVAGAPADASDASAREDAATTPPVVCGAVTCKVHEICAPSTLQCACAVGYENHPVGGACVWRGGPKDPDFTNTPPGTWILDGGAEFDPTATSDDGGIGLGKARGAGSLSQTFEMPPIESAEPLALLLRVGRTSTSTTAEVSFGIGSVAFAVPTLVDSTISAYDTVRMCLGERGFGAGASLALFGDVYDSDARVLLDRAEYRPEPSCPMPAKVPNGDFEGKSGWSSAGGGAIVAGIGAGGGTGARLNNACALNLVSGLASFPDKPGTALRFTHRSTSDPSLGRLSVLGAQVPFRAAFAQDTVCAPAHARGNVVPVGFSAERANNGLCSQTAEVIIDDVSVVDDPKCNGSGFLFDGGFEEPISYWLIEKGFSGRYQATTSITSVEGEVRSGGRALKFSTNGVLGNFSAGATQIVTVPPPTATAGPAVTFWYKTKNTDGVMSGIYGSKFPPFTLLSSIFEWKQGVTCLPPARVGMRFELRFGFTGEMNSTGLVDDVSVETHPSCPTK